ncbi:MAG: aminopeptidase [Bdellovibrio sp. CG10_big_fil_rev_8_21_14_0_10_47_8]|nr:MAG: aminopeptidase [Bdellovibrio sp. CG10_big_fil_rev_8_21_14_0_10_47_8]
MAKKQNVSQPLFCPIPSLFSQVRQGLGGAKGLTGHIHILGGENAPQFKTWIQDLAPEWQQKTLLKSSRESYQFVSNQGPVWILQPKNRKGPFSHHGQLEESAYSWFRDQAGGIISLMRAYQVEKIQVQFHHTNDVQELGFWVGMDLAAYQYRQVVERSGLKDMPTFHFVKHGGPVKKNILAEARSISAAVNLARHLVNTPPNYLNPASLAAFAKKHFSNKSGLKLQVWDAQRLRRENMNLHLAVGQGAEHGPRLLHLKYRPSGAGARRKKPIAFVGKGVTFDSGGLDIKPSSGMRLMKKDMGGAAAVLGVAQWAVESRYSQPLDFYLALAENSVDGKSFRPSDVITARNGMKIEIHNTDAEGRLVLADALDVAVTAKGADEPEMVVDVATLTGAIKVALGADLAGLFSNHDPLAQELERAGQRSGDLSWRMPLYNRYNAGMSTPFADIVNAMDGFGGAITAALFLEKFVRQKPWAHLDIYAWNDKSMGPYTSSGGSGQAVQCLIEFLQQRQAN